MNKPKIKKSGSLYKCELNGIIGCGSTPKSAYNDYIASYNQFIKKIEFSSGVFMFP